MDETIRKMVETAQFDAHALLNTVSPKALERVSAYLGTLFGARSVFSTVYDGPRRDAADEIGALADSLKMLTDALDKDQLLRDPLVRDYCATEARSLAFIRQLEGHSPHLPGVLSMGEMTDSNNAITEAIAAGFALGDPDPDGVVHTLGILPPRHVQVLDEERGEVRFGAGADWDMLDAALQPAGLTAAMGLRDVFPTPVEAAEAGILAETKIERRHNRPWSVTSSFPPQELGRIERTWVFSDISVAEAVLMRVAKQYTPLWMETIPSVDANVMAAVGAWRKRRAFRSLSSGALRVVFSGTPIARQAALMEASWGIERAGGVCHHRRPPAGTSLLSAIGVAAGAARLSRLNSSTAPLPDGAISQTKMTAVRGHLRQSRIVWYPRDLSRSLTQAQRTLGLPETPPSQGDDATASLEEPAMAAQ